MVKNKQYYHISHLQGLEAAVPFQGRVYVTTREFIPTWVSWVRNKHNIPAEQVYIYEIDIPADAKIGVGIEGEENGDFYVETDVPLPVKIVEWDLRRNRPRRVHKNKYK